MLENPETIEAPKVEVEVHPNRLAIFGGSFDPVHNGHLELAKAVLAKDLTNEVLFVPAAKPPHKRDRKLLSGKHRLAMLDAMIGDDPLMSYSDYEVVKGKQLSFTIQTLRAMSHIYPEKEISLIIGMDNLLDLNQWNSFRSILDDYKLIVFTRPGVAPASYADLQEKLGAKYANRILDNVITDVNFDISSTEIREKLSNGEDVSHLVPNAVWDYIQEQELY